MGVSHHWKQAAVRWYLIAKTPIRHAVVSQLNWAIIGIWQNNGGGGFTACHCFSFNLIAATSLNSSSCWMGGSFWNDHSPNLDRTLHDSFSPLLDLYTSLWAPFGMSWGFSPLLQWTMVTMAIWHAHWWNVSHSKNSPTSAPKGSGFGGSHRDGWVHWRPFTRVLPPTYIP